MKDIREQLLDLGFTEAAVEDLNKLQEDNRFVITDLKDQFLSVIMNRDELGKFYDVACSHNLNFQKKVRRDLHAIYQNAVKSQYLDISEVERYFQSLNIKLAKGRDKSRKVFVDRSAKNRKSGQKKYNSRSSKRPLRVGRLSAAEKAEALRAATKIGLGIESCLKLPRVRRDAVIIDIHTSSERRYDKSILYAAGHSLKSEPED